MPGSLHRGLGNLHLRSRSEPGPPTPSNTTGLATPPDPAQVSPPISAPVGPPISTPASPPASAPASPSDSPTISPLPGQPPPSPLRPSSATYHPGSTPRAVLCRHIVPTPSPPSASLPDTCPTCTLLAHVHSSQRSWRTARAVYGHDHRRTKDAKTAYHRAKCAHANHLAARSGRPSSPSPSRAPRARKTVSFAADVADTEGARRRRQFCRKRWEYVPGRWAGELLDTSGSEVPAEVFYAEPEARDGRGVRTFSTMVALGIRARGTRVRVGFFS